MNKNIVRIQTELFKADEKVRGHLIDIYLKPPRHCVWYPHKPAMELIPDPEGIHSYGHPGEMLVFKEGGLFFSFHSLGKEVDGFSTGDIDFLLKNGENDAASLFGEDLPHFAQQAQMSLMAFRDNARWATLAVYNVDVPSRHVEFEAGLELEELMGDQLIDIGEQQKREEL